MTVGYYLLDHPNPNYPQTRPRSAWGWGGPTGLVTVHTAEGALDRIAPDTGAENVANFIATRSDAGGYHELVDTDSFIPMAPDDLMTWHTAAFNLNGPGWGISAACRSVEWDPDAQWTRTIIGTMGARICAFWQRTGHDPVASARWLSLPQVRDSGGKIVGLVHHGVVQPGDRSDAWATHPAKARLDKMLIDAIVAAASGVPPEDDVTEAEIEAIAERSARKTAALVTNVTDGSPAPYPANLTHIDESIQAIGAIITAGSGNVDTAAILAAINRLPAATIAELKAAL